MSTLRNSLEVAARVAIAMRLGLALRHLFRAARRTVSPAGIFSKISAAQRASGGNPVLSQLGAALELTRLELAGLGLARAELVAKIRAADQPVGRLRGTLGEPDSAGLYRF